MTCPFSSEISTANNMYLRAEWSLRLADPPLSPKMFSEMEWQICTLGAL